MSINKLHLCRSGFSFFDRATVLMMTLMDVLLWRSSSFPSYNSDDLDILIEIISFKKEQMPRYLNPGLDTYSFAET